jgi:hypothetical protein
MNLDTFTEFLKWKFPRKNIAKDDGHLSRILSIATKYGYPQLSDLNQLLIRTKKARAAMNSKRRTPFAVSEIARAVALEQLEYRAGAGWNNSTRLLLNKYKNLISK